jgi:hypothetical protein
MIQDASLIPIYADNIRSKSEDLGIGKTELGKQLRIFRLKNNWPREEFLNWVNYAGLNRMEQETILLALEGTNGGRDTFFSVNIAIQVLDATEKEVKDFISFLEGKIA